MGLRQGSVVGRRMSVAAVVLIAALAVQSVSASAQGATPSLLAGEQVDGHNSALNAVSCASPSRCVTGGLDLIVQDHGVRSDLSSKLSPDTDEIAAIACASGSSLCEIGDDSGGAYTLSGQTLSSRTQVTSSAGFDAISCPTQTFCIAIDDLGEIYKFSGSGWSYATQLGALAQSTTSLQVSCASQLFCMATLPGSGNAEDYYTWTGTVWGGTHVLENTGAIETGLSCTTTTFCVATDSSDFALRYNGTSWSPTSSRLVSGPHPTISSTSAAPEPFASRPRSRALTRSHRPMARAGRPVRTSRPPTAAMVPAAPTSCATSSMCAIVDQSGNGYTYALPDGTG